jgi:hypothetical protein
MKRVAVTYRKVHVFQLNLGPDVEVSGQHFVTEDEYKELERLQGQHEEYQRRLGNLAGQQELEFFEAGGKRYLIHRLSSDCQHYYPVDEFGQVSFQFYRGYHRADAKCLRVFVVNSNSPDSSRFRKPVAHHGGEGQGLGIGA